MNIHLHKNALGTAVVLALLALAAVTVGCKPVLADDIECNYWQRVAQDSTLSDEIINWLDARVFNRRIDAQDRTIGRLGIPGRHGAIKSKSLGDELPVSLAGAEIRPIYFNPDLSVGAVCAGRYNGIGIFVDQSDIHRLADNSEISPEAFGWKSTRLAVACMRSDW